MTGSTVSVDFKAIDEILESCNYSKQYLIAMLQKVQEIYKYLQVF